MNDMRYKLSTALFEAGLHQTDYAKAVMSHVGQKGN